MAASTSSTLPRSLESTAPQTPSRVTIKTEDTTPDLPSHNRFRNVVKSYLPGRPDLAANSSHITTSTPSASTPAPTTPPSTFIKQEPRSTPTTSSDDTISSLGDALQQNAADSPIKPAHISHLTEEEYRERVDQINMTRDWLKTSMQKSLILTRELAARRRKQDIARQPTVVKNKDSQKLAQVIEEAQNYLRGMSIDMDRQVIDEADGLAGKKVESVSGHKRTGSAASKLALNGASFEPVIAILGEAAAMAARMRNEADQ